jgi:putative SOS response-associated peptidase YedK
MEEIGDKKHPFKIHLKDEPIMSVAGIWDTWKPGTPDERCSFSIMTTTANELMSEIHDRMPVILGHGDEEAWLDPEVHEPEELKKALKPCPSDWLVAVEVSRLVNSARNDSSAILEPMGPFKIVDGPLRLFD